MKKILFLINSLGGGGAERVLVNLVNHMDISRYDITIETMFYDGSYLKLLKPDINYFCKKAPCSKGISKIYKFIPSKLLYRYFVGNRKYDLMVAYLQGAPVKILSGCTDKNTKKIAWLHSGNPEQGSFTKFWINNSLAFKAYGSFDAIVGVADSVTKAFGEYSGIRNKLYTVYNTNDYGQIREMAKQKTEFFYDRYPVEICTAGRLVSQKGYDRLIRAVGLLKKEGYKFRVSIMGTGSEKYTTKLKKLMTENDVADCVRLLGFQDNPFSIMANSDLYILSSREEGLATVLTEALFTGLPIVATDVSGTREVLGDNSEFGLVVENSEDGVYFGLKKMLDNPDLLKKYRESAMERAGFFTSDKTVPQAEELFDKLLAMGVNGDSSV